MIIRQNFTESASGRVFAKEIEIRLEEIRSTTSFSEISLIASCDDESVAISPTNEIEELLDAKRTYCPSGLKQSYLVAKSNGTQIEVANVCFEVGDPIAVMGDLKGTNIKYGLVTGIQGNVMFTTEFPEFGVGSIVQNLCNRWWTPKLSLGINSKLHQLQAIPFSAKREENRIVVSIITPMNTNVIKFYDVYVRDHKFSSIEPHWVPDASDIDITQNSVSIDICEGYVTVITKDRVGRVNINESACEQVEFVGQ